MLKRAGAGVHLREPKTVLKFSPSSQNMCFPWWKLYLPLLKKLCNCVWENRVIVSLRSQELKSKAHTFFFFYFLHIHRKFTKRSELQFDSFTGENRK